MKMRLRWTVAAGFAVWCAGAEALAQGRCATQARAEALEAQGVRARDERQDEAARAAFTEAWQLCRGTRALARLGLAEKALGRWLDAEEHLAAALATRDAWVAGRRGVLEGELARVRDHLGELLLVGEAPAGAVWSMGGRTGTLPMEQPARVVAGTVSVTVQAPGFAAVTRDVPVAARTVVRERVELARVAAAEPAPTARVAERPAVALRVLPAREEAAPVAPTPRREEAAGLFRVLGGVSGGVALATFVATVVVHARREDVINSTNRAYGADPRCSAVERDVAYCGAVHGPAVEADESLTPWVVAGYVVSGAFAATSAVLFAVGASRSREERRMGLRCGGGPGLVGVSCGYSF